MTKTAKLQAKMKEKGYTIKTLAGVINLSATGLFNKIHNQREFVVSEVQAIGIALGLTDTEITEIFFARDVELNSTSKTVKA